MTTEVRWILVIFAIVLLLFFMIRERIEHQDLADEDDRIYGSHWDYKHNCWIDSAYTKERRKSNAFTFSTDPKTFRVFIERKDFVQEIIPFH